MFSKKLLHDIQKRALQKLRMLQVAYVIDDLKIPPSNHLEALTGDSKVGWTLVHQNEKDSEKMQINFIC